MKPDVAFYWCASCGGCEEAVLDLNEEILNVADAVNIVFWPVALDFKEKDVAARPDGSILVSFINGAVRTGDQVKMARLLRQKSKLVVAFGVCAQLGGIPGLANLTDARGILEEVYDGGAAPLAESWDEGHALTLPVLLDAVLALDRVIAVDYYVPGCPPTPKIIAAALHSLLGAELPARGTVLAPDQALCEQCPRQDSRHNLMLKQYRRVVEYKLDPQVCILAQGILCLGAATRAGCEARCIGGNMPCTGCFGPTSRVRDFGAKALSAAASIVDSTDEGEVEKIFDSLADPAGTFYRYSLPASPLGRRRLG